MSDAEMLTKWREQTEGRKFSFAAPDHERCEAVREDKATPFPDEERKILYRCGKRAGHDGRHECSDEGAFTLKWGWL